jgi:GT2 family glycosyltransferase/glycosyltransferase involved in cell wall biosynthesis/SAM-dependent methyltransferase
MYSPELQPKTTDKLKEFLAQASGKIECLAWGAVFSSLELVREYNDILQITAIEHDRNLSSEADRIRVSSKYASSLDIHCIENNQLFSGSGDYDSFRDYIIYPTKWKKKFDLIIINGMAKKEALNISQMLLSRGGLIIITEENGDNYENYLANDVKFFSIEEENGQYHKAYFISDSKKLIDSLNKTEIESENTSEIQLDKTPMVSVIVTTLDRPAMLRNAIQSIVVQTYQDFEIIVVNDGGDDVSSIHDYDHRIHLINHDIRRGISAARNSGLDQARGKYIAYLDDDDYYANNHLEVLVNFLEEGEFDAAYTDAYRAFQDLKDGELITTKRDYPFSQDWDFKRLLVSNYVPNLCLMHKKECLEKSGYFDENLETHVDWDFLIRIGREYKVKHIGLVTCEYTSRDNGTNITSRRELMLETLREVYKKTEDLVIGINDIIEARKKFESDLEKEIIGMKKLEMLTKASQKGILRKIDVSIIIPCFNNLDYTKYCFRSVQDNTDKDISYEVIFVDNNSSDGTKEYLLELEEKHANVTCIRNEENYGFAKACNQGIDAAKGDYVLLLNNDTVAWTGWLSNLLKEANSDETIGIVGSLLLYPDSKLIQHCGVRIGTIDGNVTAYHANKLRSYDKVVEAMESRDVQAVTAACMLIKRDLIIEIGKFDEAFKNGLEDVDFCLRAGKAGYRIRYCHKSILFHHESISDNRNEFNDYNADLLFGKWNGKIEPDESETESKIGVWDILAREKLQSDPNDPIHISILLNSARFRGDSDEEAKWKHKLDEINEQPFDESMKYSIIIPTYDNLEYTKACVSSIQTNTRKGDYEIILVDNASADGTKDYIKELNYNNTDIEVIINDSNLGFAKACNQGIEAAKGKYIILLNNDTLPQNSWAEKLYAEFEKDEKVGIAGGCLLYPHNDLIQHLWVQIGTEDGKTIAPYHIFQYQSPDEVPESHFSRNCTAVTGACIMISREVLDKIGKLDEGYLNGLEDIDYCFAAGKAGYTIRYAAGCRVYHHESLSKGRHDNDIDNWNRLNEKWLGEIDFDESQMHTNKNVSEITKRRNELLGNSESDEQIEEIIEDIKTEETTNETEANQERDKSIPSDYFDVMINKKEDMGTVFSVVIPVHNNLEITKQCIEGLIKTKGFFYLDIIVIDNGSDDGTSQFLKGLGDVVTVIRNEENEIYSKTNNQGAEIAKGKYLIFLNNDTYPFAGWLDAIFAEFENNPDAAIQGAKLLYPNGTIQHAGMIYGKRPGRDEEPYHAYLTVDPTLPFVNKKRQVQFVTGACLAIRKEIFNEVGGFDEGYEFGYEDIDLCMKINDAGYQVIYNPEATLYHYESMTKKLRDEHGDNLMNMDAPREVNNRQRFKEKWEYKVKRDAYEFYKADGFRLEGYTLAAINPQPQDYEEKEFKKATGYVEEKEIEEKLTQLETNSTATVLIKAEQTDFHPKDLIKFSNFVKGNFKYTRLHLAVPSGMAALFENAEGIESTLKIGSDEAVYLEALADIVMDYDSNAYNAISTEERDELKSIAEAEHYDSDEIDIDLLQEVVTMKSKADKPARKQSNKRKIMITMFGWSEKGGGTYIPKSLGRALVRKGYEVAIFYAGGVKEDILESYEVDKRNEEGIQLYGVYNRAGVFLDIDNPEREIIDIKLNDIFAEALDEFQPDLVNFHNFLGLSFEIARTAKARAIPTVFTTHNYHPIDPSLYLIRDDMKIWQSIDFNSNSDLPERFPYLQELYVKRDKVVLEILQEKIDYIFAVSTRVKEIYTEYGIDENKIAVINQMPESVGIIKQLISNDKQIHHPLRFGYIGSVMSHKGLHVLAIAAKAFRKGEVEFIIYGDVNPEYKKILEQLDEENMMRFAGEYILEDFRTISEELDAIIVPSVWEDCAPLVLVEALAMKLPVIAANIGGMPDFIKHGENGMLYRYNSAKELAEIIFKFIRDPKLLNQLRENIQIPYNFNDWIDHICESFEKIILDKVASTDDLNLLFMEALKPKEIEEVIETEQPLNKDLNFPSGGFSSKQASGQMPDPLPAPLMLNLGCGLDIRQGFVNIDLYSDSPQVVGMDIRRLALADEVVDLILASDILEHFSHREVDDVLKEWARVLKPGGELIIRCPSLRLQVKAYTEGYWDADIASYMIFGGQTNPGDYHCLAFDDKSIKRHLEAVGLVMKELEEQDIPQTDGYINLNMTVKAVKPGKDKIMDLKDFKNTVEDVTPQEPQVDAQQDESKQDPEPEMENYGNHFAGFDFSAPREDAPQEDAPALDTSTEDAPAAAEMIESTSIPAKIKEAVESIPVPEIAEETVESIPVPEIAEETVESIPVPEIAEETTAVETTEDSYPKLNIVWEGSQFVYHSLALVNREHCANIIDSGLAELTIVPFENDTFAPEGNEKYEKLKTKDIRFKPEIDKEIAALPYVWIRHQWPPKDEKPQGAAWIINQPWEYSVLRKDFVPLFQQADEIWTPSSFSRQSMIDSGIDFNKVQIVPNGIDPQLFRPKGDSYLIPTKKKIKFLFIGGTIFRKGIDILLHAFTHTFSDRDDVCLFIKDMGGDTFYKGQTAHDKIEAIKNKPNAPEIHYYDEYMTEDQMTNLYRSCDVFVCSYRGEGFSLPTLEAMACGLPVIVTKGGSTDDFVDEEVGWQIPAEKRSIGTTLGDMEFVGEAHVLEPSVEALGEILKSVYLDSSEVISKGLVAQYKARKFWNWRRATIKMYSRLDSLYGLNMAREAEMRLPEYTDGDLLVGEAEYLLKHDKTSEAVLLFEKAIEDDFISVRAKMHAYSRLTIYYSQNNSQRADECLNSGLELNPNNPDINYAKARLHLAKNETTEALETYTKLFQNWLNLRFDTSMDLTLGRLLCETADTLLLEEDAESALKLYTEALRMDTNSAHACYGSARCFMTVDARTEAIDMLEWTLQLDPDHAEAKLELDRLS